MTSFFRSLLRKKNGGAEGDRTLDLSIANAALSQLSYGPVPWDAYPIRLALGLQAQVSARDADMEFVVGTNYAQMIEAQPAPSGE